MDQCPFCGIDAGRLWIVNEHAVALPETAPIVDGHMLIAPRKHVASIYELSILEQQAVFELVSAVRARLLTGLMPDGFSIGFSDVGETGDSGHHAHIHVVPRRRGDDPDLPSAIEWVTDDHVWAQRK